MRRVDARTEAVAALERVAMFEALSPEDLDGLVAVARLRFFEPGQTLLHEGDEADTCLVIRSGAVRGSRSYAGRSTSVAEFGAGEVVGELAVVDGHRRASTVEALEPTRVLVLPAVAVLAVMRRHPEVAESMLAGLSERLHAANERIAARSLATVPGRVAAALLGQVEKRRRAGAAPRDVVVRANQADIAALAGSSRESASRFLAVLERAGLVSLGRGKVTVHEPAALRRYIN